MTAASHTARRLIPVHVVLPPHTLLMDVAGPLEVLRYANLEQEDILFEYHYIAARPQQTTSIGLTLANLEPLPDRLPENAYALSRAARAALPSPNVPGPNGRNFPRGCAGRSFRA